MGMPPVTLRFTVYAQVHPPINRDAERPERRANAGHWHDRYQKPYPHRWLNRFTKTQQNVALLP